MVVIKFLLCLFFAETIAIYAYSVLEAKIKEYKDDVRNLVLFSSVLGVLWVGFSISLINL